MVRPRLNVGIHAAPSPDGDAALVSEAKSCKAPACGAIGVAEKSDTDGSAGPMQRERKDNYSQKQSHNNEGSYSHRTHVVERCTSPAPPLALLRVETGPPRR